MRIYSSARALARHQEITARPVNVTALRERFKPVPRDSTKALLIKMGPFIAGDDAFRFTNSFPITGEIGAKYLDFFQREVQEVARLGSRPYREFLSSLEIDFELFKVGLPNELINQVVTTVITQLAGGLVDVFTDPSDSDYGRCGGMAFAGYDFYLQGWRVDGFGPNIPAEDTPLDEYLLGRLLDSLDLNARTFLEWIMILHVMPHVDEIATAALLAAAGNFAFPVGPAVGAFIGSKVDIFDLGGPKRLLDKTKDEWSIIKRMLDEQAAWPIGLVFGNKISPFNQHQVLAIGYEDTGLGAATLRIWDNRDGNVAKDMSLDFRGDELVERGAVEDTVKGIFHEEYAPQKPLQSLKLP
jgi:hypothetical protein